MCCQWPQSCLARYTFNQMSPWGVFNIIISFWWRSLAAMCNTALTIRHNRLVIFESVHMVMVIKKYLYCNGMTRLQTNLLYAPATVRLMIDLYRNWWMNDDHTLLQPQQDLLSLRRNEDALRSSSSQASKSNIYLSNHNIAPRQFLIVLLTKNDYTSLSTYITGYY